MSRIPYLRREELGPEGQQLWDALVNGRGELIVTADGGLAGPFNAFVTAPGAGRDDRDLDSRRSIEVPNLSFAPSEDSRRPAPGAVTNALNGPARPPSAVTTRSLRPSTMASHSCWPSGPSSSRRR